MQILRGKSHDLGGFAVRRMLPAPQQRMVGPFIFFDHFGPATLAPDVAMDVRPHPHIGLATVTYLYEGAIMHRDSLGCAEEIRPGDINWMIAGGGIVHSERTPASLRGRSFALHGLQCWLALPDAHEDDAAEFFHYPASDLPQLDVAGARLRVLAGDAFGRRSPVKVHQPTLYVDVLMPAGSGIAVPEEHEERAVYLLSGELDIDGNALAAGEMALLRSGECVLRATRDCLLVLLGGQRFGVPRHIWWNFVASNRERIDRAGERWRNRDFPTVPGDEVEFIPLPEERSA
ncbi:MAG: pirin family protein [Steroidobacteraceae bacterium]